MTPNVAKCLLVSKVLVADGMMQEAERGFLRAVMEQLGLSALEQRQVIDLEGLDAADGVVRGLPAPERQALVELLVDAASADGKLGAHELDAVKRLTSALGL